MLLVRENRVRGDIDTRGKPRTKDTHHGKDRQSPRVEFSLRSDRRYRTDSRADERVFDGRRTGPYPLRLPEGSEVTAMVSMPDGTETEPKARLVLPKWNLGVKEPLTRREIYEDAG